MDRSTGGGPRDRPSTWCGCFTALTGLLAGRTAADLFDVDTAERERLTRPRLLCSRGAPDDDRRLLMLARAVGTQLRSIARAGLGQ